MGDVGSAPSAALHQRYGRYVGWHTEPVFTEELDILLPVPLQEERARALASALVEAGFSPAGGTRPSAVWVRAVEAGERLEFFVPHTGPGRTLGSVRSVAAGSDVGALSLHGLESLQEWTVEIRVPIESEHGESTFVTVRVPELEVFVAQKSAAFPRRTDRIKQAKDLFYLVEIMAAGAELQENLEQRIAELYRRSAPVRRDAETGCHHLRSVLGGEQPLGGLLRPLAEMVEHRYSLSPEAAEARSAGYLRDLLEILEASTAG